MNSNSKPKMSNKAQAVLVIISASILLLLATVVNSEAKASRKTIQEQDCEQAVLLFADEGTDMYHEHMELCTTYDPDYLTEVAPALDEYISDEEIVQ